MSELRKYSELLTNSKAVPFSLYKQDGLTYATSATVTFAAGDVLISKDGGAFGNVLNLPVAAGNSWHLILTAAELTAARVIILISDATATQVWLDSDLVIETYGHANAMHQFDLGIASVAQTGDNYLGVTAQSNIILQYNGTGITGDNFPATQAQAGNIASGSGSIGANVTSEFITTGTPTLTYTAVQASDGVLHEVAAVGGLIDYEYRTTLVGNGVLTDILWKGFAQGNASSVVFQFYDWVAGQFVTEETFIGSNGEAIVPVVVYAVAAYTGTGINNGEVRFRILSSTASRVATDRFIFGYTVANQSIGYEGQQVFIDTVEGTAGTINNINGVGDKPSLTLADALSLLTITNLHKLKLSPETSIELTAPYTNGVITGTGSTLLLGAQDITNSHFFNLVVSGIATTLSGYRFHNTRLSNVTIGSGGHFENCTLDGTFTLSNIGVYMFHQVSTRLTPTVDFLLLGGSTLNLYEFSGDLIVANMAAGDLLHVTGNGSITVATSTGGTIEHDGFIQYVDAVGNVSQLRSDIENNVIGIQADTSVSIPALIDDLGIKKNVSGFLPFDMVLASDGRSPGIGLTVTVEVLLDNAPAYIPAVGTVTEISDGTYRFDYLAADSNANIISWKFAAITAETSKILFKTVA